MNKYFLLFFTAAMIGCVLISCRSSKHENSVSTENVSDDSVKSSAGKERVGVESTENSGAAQNEIVEERDSVGEYETDDKKYAEGIKKRKTYFYYENEGANERFTLQKQLAYESFQVSIYEIWTDEAEKLGLTTKFGKSNTDTTSCIGVKFEPAKPEVSMYALENFDSDGGIGYNTTVTYIPTGKYEDLTVGSDSRTLNIEYLRMVQMTSTDDENDGTAVCQSCRIIVNDGYANGALKQWCGTKVEMEGVTDESEVYKKCLSEATVKNITNEEYAELYDRLIGQFRNPNILG